MEKKQGFFSALKEEVIRGLSPARSRGRRRSSPAVSRSGGLRPSETLSPLMEGPDSDNGMNGRDSKREKWGSWMKSQVSRAHANSTGATAAPYQHSDIRLLLGVMGAPLAPVHVSSSHSLPHLSIKNSPIETLSAGYILQQYTAASGGGRLQNTIHNTYAMGKIKMMAYDMETAAKVIKTRKTSAESGSFVIWQMNPDMWYVELALGPTKIHAGCNGKLVWRHTPWLGPHAAKGPVRPLRRALQGLDPRATASMFSKAKCIGEKKINGEDCFILKLCADTQTLKARSEGAAEIIRHILFGYFSQRTGLLIHLEDSHLTRIQTPGGIEDSVYWETTTNTILYDYKPVDGIMIAHSGRSVVTVFRFGETAMSHTKTRMEEVWSIDEVAFNVACLSADCFIPPAELMFGSSYEKSHEQYVQNLAFELGV